MVAILAFLDSVPDSKSGSSTDSIEAGSTTQFDLKNLKRPVGMLLDDFGKRVILESILPDPFRFYQFNLRVLEERCE